MQNNNIITIELTVCGEFATKQKEYEAIEIVKLARAVGWNVDMYIGEPTQEINEELE